MNVTIRPGRADGVAAVPPSKSCAHRLLICGALAKGTSVIDGVIESEDMLATLDCLRALGASVTKSGAVVTVCGRAETPAGPFPCRESGSTLRFLLPVALALGTEAVFTGTERLMARGVSVYEEALAPKGITFTHTPRSLTVRGALTPGEYILRGDVSSQFVSGLLLALPLLAGESVIRLLPPVESRSYIGLTLDALAQFGVRIEAEGDTLRIPGGQPYMPCRAYVEGDWSNAAALAALNALGGHVTLTGLNPDSRQGDRVCLSLLARLDTPDAQIDLSDCPDLGPVLFAAAALKNGARFTGTRRLRIKESDRAAAMARELAKFGIRAEVGENDVRILPGTLVPPKEPLESHNDHRVVMALTLLAARAGGTVTGAEAVNKSFPGFFRTVRDLGLEIIES